MITLEQIRDDLREIRYYYARKTQVDDVSKKIGDPAVRCLVEKYNRAICIAPLRLYDIYACLYVRGQTQEELADELSYTPQYIRKLIAQLPSYFKTKFNEMEVKQWNNS